MKIIKFDPELVRQILDGAKKTTWRLFDDKGLQAGDEVALVNKATLQLFAYARLVHVSVKRLADVTEEDYSSHERYASPQAMIAHFRGFYGERVSLDTEVKVIAFELTDVV